MSAKVCVGDMMCFATSVNPDVIKYIIIGIIIFFPLVIGMTIGAMYRNAWDNPKYKNLKKPAYNPPSYAFGIAWTILYLAIGIIYSYALYDYKVVANKSIKTITYFKDFKYWVIPIVALLFNFIYIPTFFGENGLLNGFIIIIFSLVFAVATLLQFYFQDNYDPNTKYYAILALLPYIIWLSFASALSFDIYRLNE
jgi:tryptophan-rich sensory protein